MSQVHTFDLESRALEFRAQLEEYEHFVRENFLMFYLAYQRSGETVSAEVGEQDKSPPQFSLSEFVTMRNHHRITLSKRHKV